MIDPRHMTAKQQDYPSASRLVPTEILFLHPSDSANVSNANSGSCRYGSSLKRNCYELFSNKQDYMHTSVLCCSSLIRRGKQEPSSSHQARMLLSCCRVSPEVYELSNSLHTAPLCQHSPGFGYRCWVDLVEIDR